MNYKYILREIKISKLTGIPMSGDAAKLDKFWSKLWLNMKVSVDPKRGEIRCCKDDYEYYYFLQIDKNDYLWCDYYKIWRFFHEHLILNHVETQKLIQHMVNETLNCGVNTPKWTMGGINKPEWPKP